MIIPFYSIPFLYELPNIALVFFLVIIDMCIYLFDSYLVQSYQWVYNRKKC